jgi:uncharacterized protein (TIGR02246 family)
MSHSIALRSAITFALFTDLSFSQAADVPVQSNDDKPVRALIAAFSEAFAKLDAHAFSMVFHEDADFTNALGITTRGRKAIEEYHRPLLEADGMGPTPSFKHAEFKVVETHIRFVRPDVASVDITWSETGVVQDGKNIGTWKGILILTATRERDGWGIAVMHNMDLPVTE